METDVRTLAVYERMMAIIWRRLAPTFGSRTIAAIARNVVARDARRFPLLALIEVEEQGLRWEALRAQVATRGDEVAPALEALLDDLFEALSDLIGRLIVSEVVAAAREGTAEGEEE